MLALEVEYLLGRVFAGSFRDRAEIEWPPHPGRLFSALAAAYFENGNDAREKAALEWLERQGPPHIRAGTAGEAVAVQAFVPTNYPGDGPPVIRGKQPRYFPAQGPSEATVYFIWKNAEAPAETASALDVVASRTAYLGKACSLTRMRVSETAPEPNYAPDSAGDYVLRVANQGRLAELEWLFEAGQQVSTGAQQRYRPVERELAETGASEFGSMVVFRKSAGPGLPIEGTLSLSEAVRKALMSNAGSSGAITELIHGHNGDTHCAIAALPFVRGDYGDGHLMGFAVVLPRAVSIEDRRNVLAACERLVENGLHLPGLGRWELEPADESAPKQALRPATWTRTSRVWKTVTPILLDKFPKKGGPTVEQILSASCRRIGLPDPARVEHGPYSQMKGVSPVPAFRLRRPSEDRARWGVHATIEFANPVRGPVLLGAGRYFGLGLMRPEGGA